MRTQSIRKRILATAVAAVSTAAVAASALADDKVLLWGDTHLHTNLSPGAYVNKNTTVTPDTAYRFAGGMAVIADDTRAKVKLETPLDLLGVTDHAECAGVPKLLWGGDDNFVQHELLDRYQRVLGERVETQGGGERRGAARS